jgi:hypothetical protein
MGVVAELKAVMALDTIQYSQQTNKAAEDTARLQAEVMKGASSMRALRAASEGGAGGIAKLASNFGMLGAAIGKASLAIGAFMMGFEGASKIKQAVVDEGGIWNAIKVKFLHGESAEDKEKPELDQLARQAEGQNKKNEKRHQLQTSIADKEREAREAGLSTAEKIKAVEQDLWDIAEKKQHVGKGDEIRTLEFRDKELDLVKQLNTLQAQNRKEEETAAENRVTREERAQEKARETSNRVQTFADQRQNKKRNDARSTDDNTYEIQNAVAEQAFTEMAIERLKKGYITGHLADPKTDRMGQIGALVGGSVNPEVRRAQAERERDKEMITQTKHLEEIKHQIDVLSRVLPDILEGNN